MNLKSFDTLKTNFTGEVILPEDPAYEQARVTMFEKTAKPAIIVRPHNAKDVTLAIAFARENKLLISVRSGGHSNAGLSSNTGGIVIDVSSMNTIEVIDQEKHVVRVGAGARWIEVATKLKEYNLALSSGDTKTVGVGGLTLAGGIGWMVRKYGLAIDSLAAAEIVTADGNILRASEEENADLFWAIRGGGGNFGVATYFEFIAHPVSTVYSGTLFYSLEHLAELLKGWRDYMRTADENLTTILNIIPSFGGNPPSAMLTICYASNDKEAAMKVIDPLKKFDGLMREDIKEKPYVDVLEDAHAPEGVKIIANNVMVEEFNDAVIGTIVAAKQTNPNLILQIRSLGGAMKRVSPESTAFFYRSSEVLVVCPVFLPPTASESEEKEALKPWETIAAFGKGAYANFFSRATEKELAVIYPKETYERLAIIKKQYDPENIFNQNYNITPK